VQKQSTVKFRTYARLRVSLDAEPLCQGKTHFASTNSNVDFCLFVAKGVGKFYLFIYLFLGGKNVTNKHTSHNQTHNIHKRR